jgi:hypothetical protein
MIRERYCQDCGRVFTAEDEDDRYCKRCLLVRYRALVARLTDPVRYEQTVEEAAKGLVL